MMMALLLYMRKRRHAAPTPDRTLLGLPLSTLLHHRPCFAARGGVKSGGLLVPRRPPRPAPPSSPALPPPRTAHLRPPPVPREVFRGRYSSSSAPSSSSYCK